MSNTQQQQDADGAGTSIAADLSRTYANLYRPQIEELLQPGESRSAQVLILPKNMRVESALPHLEAFRQTPSRRKTVDVVTDLASLIELTNRHGADATTLVFANPDRKNPSIQTVFDYHPEGDDLYDARWREHRVAYTCQLSEEWRAWLAVNRQSLTQNAFAEFVEDRLSDVVEHDDAAFPDAAEMARLLGVTFATPAELVRISRGLQVHVGSKVRNAVTTSSGEISMVFEQQHQTEVAGVEMRVPSMFIIGIPVFQGGKRWIIAARLRYRVEGAALKWTIVLYRHEAIFDNAFKQMVDAIREQTKFPVVAGGLGQ